MTTINAFQSSVSYESIKLGIDAHAQYYWVSRQVDGATPQPVQKMTYDELMLFVVKQQKLTRKMSFLLAQFPQLARAVRRGAL
jgi:hypothetical protein